MPKSQEQIRVEQALGIDFAINDETIVHSLTRKLEESLLSKAAITAFLAKQGLPSSSLKVATTASLAKAYILPAYLRTWRNRLNPNWELLNTADNEAETFIQTKPKTEAKVEAKTEEATTASKSVSEAWLRDLFTQIKAMVAKSAAEKIADAKLTLDEGAKQQIRALATAAAQERAEALAKPRTIEIVSGEAEGEIRSLGLQHEMFPTLLRATQARDHRGFRLNVWLTGSTGSGKTTAAENVAKALALDFGSDGSLDADYKVIGYRDANGTYHCPMFVKLFRDGGVYVADEIDNWLPSALLALNAALANGFISTPEGIIRRHPDFICIACANTWGHGATNEYVGRAKQDAASLDRFHPKIHWPVDERLEAALAETTGGDLGIAWQRVITTARKAVAAQGLKIIISPRATLAGLGLLKAGFAYEDVIDMTFFAGLSTDQKATITAALSKAGVTSWFHSLYNVQAASAAVKMSA